VDAAGLELEAGKTLCIVGESGSGKSVLCSSVLGLLPMPPAVIERGRIEFHGNDLLQISHKDMRAIRGNRISMIFQDPMTSLNPYLKVGRQLLEPLHLHQKITGEKARALAIQAMDEVGLPEPDKLLYRYPHQLSGGMRQRVMIAMALINKPEILIADEPTTALDVTIQSQILKLIKRFQRELNLTVIFVSHDLGVVSGIADHILVMQNGRIVDAGSPDHIYYKSAHPYTRNLLASIPTSAKPIHFNEADRKTDNILLSVSELNTSFTDLSRRIFRSNQQAVKAVDDVNIEIYKGETLGLVGESGSGKTTLGRSVMRLVKISSGRIVLDKCDLTKISSTALTKIRPQLQMIFQDPYASLNPRMTVYDILSEAIRVRELDAADNIQGEVMQLMQDVGLEPSQIRKYPHEFSGGQRQRIAIARALALRPKLIIADEPVSALDVTIQAQILKLLQNLVKKNQLTMLFISHDLSVVRYMSDRIAVMHHGNIVETGDTEKIFNSPEHPYTRSLLSAIPLADPKRERQKYINLESS
jgi:ABC-type microcin C transport system duplicated ATPase subunit YejF